MIAPEGLSRVEGPNLTLRFIQLEDAGYVHSLRTNPAYNLHLSEVRGTVDDQRSWIKAYKAREAEFRELYYVIERKDGTRCGVVRLYDIATEIFTWGSWILDYNKTRKAALESGLLVYMIAFDNLGLSKAEFSVHSENTNTLAFHRRFGAIETHQTDQDIYFTYPRERFVADRARYLATLEWAHEV